MNDPLLALSNLEEFLKLVAKKNLLSSNILISILMTPTSIMKVSFLSVKMVKNKLEIVPIYGFQNQFPSSLPLVTSSCKADKMEPITFQSRILFDRKYS